MLFTALELETDAFFSTISERRYQEILKQQSVIISELSATHSWVDGFPISHDKQRTDIFSALQRAAKHFRSHANQQKIKPEEEEYGYISN